MIEREVEIKKIFWKFLFSWKMIIVISLVFAMMFPYLVYVKSKKDFNKQKREIRAKYEIKLEQLIAEEIQDYADVELSSDDQNKVDLAIAYREQIDTLRNYKNTSPIFTLNPYNVKCVSLTYYIDVKEDNVEEIPFGYVDTRANAIGNMYKRYVTADEFVIGLLGDKLNDVGTSFARELISYSADADVFYLEIMLSDDMDAESTYSKADELIRSKTKDFSVVGDYDINLLVGDISYKRKTTMLEKQNEINTQITSTEKDLNSLLKDMTPAQVYFFEEVHRTAKDVEDEYNLEEKVAAESVSLEKPMIRKKFAIVGAIAGAAIVFIFIFARDMFSGKLVYESDFENVYKLKKFGSIDNVNSKKKFLADRMLVDIRNGKRKALSSGEKLEILGTSIALTCNAKNINKVCIASSSTLAVGKENLEKIKEIISKNKITVEVVDEIYYDSNSLSVCADCGNVIIVEAVGKSLYEEITKEIYKAKEYGIDILGAVVIEG